MSIPWPARSSSMVPSLVSVSSLYAAVACQASGWASSPSNSSNINRSWLGTYRARLFAASSAARASWTVATPHAPAASRMMPANQPRAFRSGVPAPDHLPVLSPIVSLLRHPLRCAPSPSPIDGIRGSGSPEKTIVSERGLACNRAVTLDAGTGRAAGPSAGGFSGKSVRGRLWSLYIRVYEKGSGVRRAATSGPRVRLRRPWALMFNAFGVEAIRPQRGRRSKPRVAEGAPWVSEVARQHPLLVHPFTLMASGQQRGPGTERNDHGERNDGVEPEAPPRPLRRRDGRRAGRRGTPAAIRRLARRTGLRGPGGAAWSDGRGDLPRRPARSSRRGRCVPGHVPRPGPQGGFAPQRRRPGRLAASRGLSRGGPAEHRGQSGGGGTSRSHRRWMSRIPAGSDWISTCRAILHEEIDRLPESHRLPVVLCDLEGLTYEQAAGRLQWTVPTLYHRLAKGRKRLRDRLVRRGVTVAAAGAALELSHASASAAVPASWAQAAVAAATGGPIPAAVAALTHTLIRSLLMTRLKIASVAVLATGRARVRRGRRRRSGTARRAEASTGGRRPPPRRRRPSPTSRSPRPRPASRRAPSPWRPATC